MNTPQSKLYLKDNPTLKDIQAYVAEMEEERGFTKVSLLQTYLLFVEEVGELAKHIRKAQAAMRIDAAKHYSDDVAEELADIMLVLSAVANRLGVDIEQAVREKEEVNKKRTWK